LFVLSVSGESSEYTPDALDRGGLAVDIQRAPGFFEMLFEQALDAVLIADDNRTYVEANPAAAELIGVGREQIIGHQVEEFFELEAGKVVPEAWTNFKLAGTQVGVCRVRRPDGAWKYASFRARANFWPGLHLSVLRDITEQRQAEQTLAARNVELELANKELAQSNAELNHFAYAVGHDMRSPLRTIGSFSQLLARRVQNDPEGQEYLSYIRDAVNVMNVFLTDLLAYAQVGRSEEPQRQIDVDIVLQWALMNLRGLIQETGAVITSDALPRIQADQGRLAQLFQNLIGNALKYRSEDTPRVHVRADKQEDDWVFSVADNGIGIPAEYRERIFDPFKRLHGSKIPGTGLGLALAKRIVENHHGRIWVESEVGKGSTFRFTIPA
jgi:two-component system, chemotaxis family, sensor kinase Cph1